MSKNTDKVKTLLKDYEVGGHEEIKIKYDMVISLLNEISLLEEKLTKKSLNDRVKVIGGNSDAATVKRVHDTEDSRFPVGITFDNTEGIFYYKHSELMKA